MFKFELRTSQSEKKKKKTIFPHPLLRHAQHKKGWIVFRNELKLSNLKS
jgi:hypothetical protein